MSKITCADLTDLCLSLRASLLAWYDANRRVLPWRAGPGSRTDPYRVWLSEIMLQQTTVPAVIPYFLKFTEKWPTVQALADAPLEEVLKEWAGLGYYARARNLHRCARIVTDERGGVFPSDPADLRTLPGVGPYTAGAIAAIAFDIPVAAMDGNIERVLARVFHVDEPLPAAKKPLRALAESVFGSGDARPGDFVQAMMDLGAGVCTPRRPNCLICPLSELCVARREGDAESLPRRASKTARPVRYGSVYWISDGQGRILTHRRPPRGLLGGMVGLPTSAWAGHPDAEDAYPSFVKSWCLGPSVGQVTHTFTHFHLVLTVVCGMAESCLPQEEGFQWTAVSDALAAMPSVFRKVARLVGTTNNPSVDSFPEKSERRKDVASFRK